MDHMMTGIHVELTSDDRERALQATYERNRPKRAAGVADQKVDVKHGTLLIDYMGLLGEMAVAKVLGVEIQQLKGLEGDEGFDLLWHDLKVQVKYTFHLNGHLIINRTGDREKIESDIYVLTKGSESLITVAGYVTRERAQVKGIVKDFGYGNNLVIEQQALTDITKLPMIGRER